MSQSTANAAEQVAASHPMGWIARIGLGARAVVYLLMGWLAVLVAMGGRQDVDQRGALKTALGQPFGMLLVWLLVAGFLAYAIWRLSEAAFGIDGGEDGFGPRVKSLVRGLAYCVFAFGAISLLNGARQSQEKQQQQLADAAMAVPGGRIILGVLGAIVVAAGVLMVVEGWTTRFMRYFDYLPPTRRKIVAWLGRVGTVTRGVVFALAGALVVLAAWLVDASKAGGINDVVQTVLDQPFGGALVAAMGVGLVVFGVYGVCEALWRHVPDGGQG